MGSTVREEITNTTTITSNSSGSSSTGSSIQTAKQWGRTFVHEFTAPIRRYQIRQGKQPITESIVNPVMPALPLTAKRSEVKLSKRELEIKLNGQSTSRSLQCYNLKGGNGPPKPLSLKTFAKLDHFDQEIMRISKELAHVTKEKEDFLKRIESDEFVDEEEEVVQKSKKNKKNKKIGCKKDVHFEIGLFKKNSANKGPNFLGMK
jgi:valyl-tRNA synthetase